MKWPPTLCWTAPKTINGNRHFQVKAYGGKNEDRWAVSYTHLTLPTIMPV